MVGIQSHMEYVTCEVVPLVILMHRPGIFDRLGLDILKIRIKVGLCSRKDLHSQTWVYI